MCVCVCVFVCVCVIGALEGWDGRDGLLLVDLRSCSREKQTFEKINSSTQDFTLGCMCFSHMARARALKIESGVGAVGYGIGGG